MALILRHYESPQRAEEAIEALQEYGVPAEQIGFLSREGIKGHFQVPAEMNPDDISGLEGATIGTLAGLVTGIAALTTPVGPLIAAGPLLAGIASALAGAATGGIVASLVESGIDEKLARRLLTTLENEQAVLLSVEVPEKEEEQVRKLLAETDKIHEEEQRYFERVHAERGDLSFEEVQKAYHFGYRAAAEIPRPFSAAEPYLRAAYPGDYDRDRDAIEVGYQRYMETVQVVRK